MLPVISLFSGALGLDLGLEQAGFTIRVAVECDKHAADTIRLNKPDLPIIEKKIQDVTTQEILDAAGLKVGDSFIVVGGPSCQAFSTAGKRKSFTDDRGTLFRHFLRVIKEAQPKFFVMENVKGILSAAIKHRPLNQRGPGYPTLSWEEQLGSAFTVVAREIMELGGYTTFDLINSADYGVPQKRERIVFIGSLEGLEIQLQQPTHSKNPTSEQLPWVTLKSALSNLNDDSPEHINLPSNIAKYIELIPTGSNWRSLPKDMQEEAVGKGVYRSWGGRTGFLRRLCWNSPSPALTTSPINKATLFAHPEKSRPLSIREYSRIQQFPDTWVFKGPKSSKYKQIGNAVPIGLGKVIGETILHAIEKNKHIHTSGLVVCNNKVLLKRLQNRNLTQLNPPSMSGISAPEDIEKWLKESKEWLKNFEAPSLDLFSFLQGELVQA
ncbi:MAG: DNA cytosine methyltransferase [Methylotenera sp.]|nr:DNA cytosine methyltransferase [Methylotenera sp.]